MTRSSFTSLRRIRASKLRISCNLNVFFSMRVRSIFVALLVYLVHAHPYASRSIAGQHSSISLEEPDMFLGSAIVLPREEGTPTEMPAEDVSLRGSKTENPPVVYVTYHINIDPSLKNKAHTRRPRRRARLQKSKAQRMKSRSFV